MALLDLFSIGIVGLVASISLFGIQSRQLPDSISNIIEAIRLDNYSFQIQVAVLGILAGILLIAKSVFSAFISRKILFFLNQRAAVTTATLLEDVLGKPYDYIKTRSPAEILFSLTRGVNSLISGILGAASQILTEIFLLFVVLFGLFFYDLYITFFCTIYFGTIAYLQTRRLKVIAELSQSQSAKSLVRSESQILDSLNLYRELHIRDARIPQIKSLIATRTEMANLNSKVLFMPYVTKYTMEIALVFGGVLLMASQFLAKDAVNALATLSVFLVAATRVTPSMLRLQQALIRFKASTGDSSRTLEMMRELENFPESSEQPMTLEGAQIGEISVSELEFRYRDGFENTIRGVSFNVKPGEMVAIVGPSGNGKSTLLDLLMGALLPNSGQVLLGGMAPVHFVREFPGKIGYVAQESIFTKFSIRENLNIGLGESEIDESKLWNALNRVGLDELVASMPLKLESPLGERGLKLSTGQRQRLSLARALLTQPRYLFLDEPTSALDYQSEKLITKLIDSLRGNTTIVLIAHRLETIKKADKVIKIVDGVMVSSGNFQNAFNETEIANLD